MTHGANTIILPIFAVGGTQLFMGKPTPTTILDAIDRARNHNFRAANSLLYDATG